MLNAILNSKSGRLNAADEQSIRWRDLFRGSEDLVTSTIFERLSYLPALTAWSLLAVAAGGQLTAYRMADLAEMEFWPFWDADDRVRGVEPDVFIRIELGDPGRSVQIIVEAKHGECPIFCVSVIWSMLPERSKDDDDFERTAGRTAEGLQAA